MTDNFVNTSLSDLDIGDRATFEGEHCVVRKVRELEPRILVKFDDPPIKVWVFSDRLRRVA
jgi:hypothetical protein